MDEDDLSTEIAEGFDAGEWNNLPEPKCDMCDGSGWLGAIGPKADGSYITSRPCPKCYTGLRW